MKNRLNGHSNGHVNGHSERNGNSRNGKTSKAQSTITPETYREHLLRAQSKGNYFHFRRDYVTSKLLTKVEALFLQDLINRGSMNKVKKDKDGYFLCTENYLERSLAWDRDTQKRLFTVMKKKGYVNTKRSGMPPKRKVLVYIEKVEEDLDKALESKSAQLGVFTPKRPIGGKYPQPYGGKNGTKKEDTNVSSQINKKNSRFRNENDRAPVNSFDGKPLPSFGKELARILYDKLVLLRRIPENARPSTWAKYIDAILRDYHRSEEEVRETMNWYVDNIGGPFIPVAKCGKAFYAKYDDIVEARRRQRDGDLKEKLRRQKLRDNNRVSEDEIA